MSSSATAAALYAATISSSASYSAVPEDAKDKKHHLKDGKGFTNPWESWREMGGPSIMKALLMYEPWTDIMSAYVCNYLLTLLFISKT